MAMANAELPKGTGYQMQSKTLYNTDDTGDWSWYIGQWTQGADNEYEYGAGCVTFTVPKIKEKKRGRTITIPCTLARTYGYKPLHAVLSTTAPVGLEWRFGPVSGVCSNVVTIDIESVYSTPMTLEFAVNDGVVLSGQTVFLYLYSPYYGDEDNSEKHCITTLSFSDAELTYAVQNGGARINTDGKMKLFPAIIYTAAGWKRYVPVVYTKDGWKRKG